MTVDMFYEDNGPPTLVAFAGLIPGGAIDAKHLRKSVDGAFFEFYGLSGEVCGSRLLVKDYRNRWYQDGVRGFDSIPALRDAISERIRGRSVFIGSSMGGFAAILYGHLCKADVVIALGPQTLLDPEARALCGAPPLRMREAQKVVATAPAGAIFDLGGMGGPHVHIYYSQDNPNDVMHANHVMGATLHPVPGRAHVIAHKMRKDGSLLRIVQEALA